MKENHIGSVVSKILQYRQTYKQTHTHTHKHGNPVIFINTDGLTYCSYSYRVAALLINKNMVHGYTLCYLLYTKDFSILFIFKSEAFL